MGGTIIILVFLAGWFGPDVIHAWTRHQKELSKMRIDEMQERRLLMEEQRKLIATPLE